MSTFKRSGGFVALTWTGKLPDGDDLLLALAAKRFRTIDTAASEEQSVGWVTQLDPSGQTFSLDALEASGEALWLVMRTDTKRLPAAIVAQHVAAAEASRGRKLSAKEAKELRADLESELLPRVLPSTGSVAALVFRDERRCLFFSTGNAALDRFVRLWRETFGDPVSPLVPLDLARSILPVRQHAGLVNLAATRLPAEGQGSLAVEPIDEWLGEEFLLWLWYRIEQHGAEFPLPKKEGTAALIIDDLLQFAPTQADEMVVTLRKGMPTKTPEARASLHRGHRPAKVRFILAVGSAQWSLTLDAKRLAVSGVKLPDDDEDLETAEERTGVRVAYWRQLHFVIARLLEQYLAARLAKGWEQEAEQMVAWMRNRP